MVVQWGMLADSGRVVRTVVSRVDLKDAMKAVVKVAWSAVMKVALMDVV